MNFAPLLRTEDIIDLDSKWVGMLIQVFNERAQPSSVQSGQFKTVNFGCKDSSWRLL